MTTYSKETALYDTGAIANDIGAAGETASKYITGIGDDGIKVHPYNETTGTVDQENYTKIDANGMEVYQDGTSMASFGTSARIGTENGARLELNSGGLTAYSDDSAYFNIDYDSGTTSTDVKKGGYTKLTTLPVASGIPSASSKYLISDVSRTVPSGATNIYIPKTVTAIYVNTHRANYSSTGTNNGYTLKSSSGTHVSYVLSSNVSLTYGTAISDITKTLLINFSSSVTVGIRQVISFDGQTVRVRFYACQNTSGSVSEVRVNPSLYYTTTANAPSFVLGTNSDTLGIFSCSIGQSLIANGANQLVTGKYNASDTSKAFIIGKGTSDSSRSNSFTVDTSGNAEAAGNVKASGNIYPQNTLMTDFVVEQGTSGIWTYRKWNSGFAECWGKYTGSIAVNTSSGSYGGYRSALITTNFPFTFTAVPNMTATTNAATGAWVNNVSPSVSAAQFYLSCGASLAAASRTVNMYAVGQWK